MEALKKEQEATPKRNLSRALGAAIEDHFREEGGRSLIDIGEALSALAKVSAHLIAGIDDRNSRERLIRTLKQAVQARVPVKRARGEVLRPAPDSGRTSA